MWKWADVADSKVQYQHLPVGTENNYEIHQASPSPQQESNPEPSKYAVREIESLGVW